MFFKAKPKKRRVIQNFSQTERLVQAKQGNRKGAIVGKKGPSIFGLILFRLTAISFLGVAIYLLFFSPYLNVTKISVNGNERTDSQEITAFLNSQMEGKYLNLLEKRNFLLLGKKSITESLEEKFKLIEEVKVEKKFPDRMEIYITDRNLGLIGCAKEKCFAVDKKGFLFDEALEKYFAWPNIVVLRDEGGKEMPLGDRFFNPEYIVFLNGVVERFREEFGVELEQEMRTPALASLDIRAKTKEGWEVYLNQDLGVEKEVKMIRVVLDAKIDPEKRRELEYVDLRTDNKVYYKFRNSESENEKSEEEKSSNDEKKEKN